jgi:hypothetical protein
LLLRTLLRCGLGRIIHRGGLGGDVVASVVRMLRMSGLLARRRQFEAAVLEFDDVTVCTR